jgi:hypothetical protein
VNAYEDRERRNVFEIMFDTTASARIRREREEGSGLGEGMTIEALPTVYCGTTFRSALEASWSATFDSLGLAWDYEPEMFTLPSGARYLPDFHLPEIGVWVEVKGTGVPRVEKAFEFGEMLACDCPSDRGMTRCFCRWPGGQLVLIGNPPKPFNPWGDERFSHWPHRSLRKLARRHGGFLDWTSTRKRAAWMSRCPDCSSVTWWDLPRCRACSGPLPGAHGYRPEDEGFEFVRISGPTVNKPEDNDHPAA